MIQKGLNNVLEFLVKINAIDPSDNDNWAISVACGEGHIKIVKLLLKDSRVDPSADKDYALRYACKNGHNDIVKLLLADSRVGTQGQFVRQ